MARTPIWKTIAGTLKSEIGAGHYRPGDKLPTEAALAARFGVNRHTVRHALSDLASDNLVRSRRGAGVFVEGAPTDYALGRRVRFHRDMAAGGRLPSKRLLRVEMRAADRGEARALDLAEGDPVIVSEGISLVEDTPVAHYISVFPHARAPQLAEAFATTSSVTEALRQCGIADYTRSQTRLSAERADATQALHLRVREGDALLKSVSLNLCPEGRPIERGTTWFVGDRVTLTVAHGEA